MESCYFSIIKLDAYVSSKDYGCNLVLCSVSLTRSMATSIALDSNHGMTLCDVSSVFPPPSSHAKEVYFLNNSIHGGSSLQLGRQNIFKVNGCLERSIPHLVFVIQQDSIMEDVSYLFNHYLIYKYMGNQVSLQFLD